MAVFHRKMSHNRVVVVKDDSCVQICWPSSCPDDDCVVNPPPPPPPPPPSSAHSISPFLILMFCALGVAFLFILYLTISTRYRFYLNNPRRRNHANMDETHQDFIDEERGPVIDHPIWLINTVGLEQSVIDRIQIFKYRRDERLTEGTECSVCLSEFDEDESLRLLPKCSHAFHVPCIDTWLRAHKNCPLCRAPIMSDMIIARTVDPDSNEVGLSQANTVPLEANSENVQVDENGTSGISGVDNQEEGNNNDDVFEKNLQNLHVTNTRVRVLSDLVDHRGKVDQEVLQPVRRSVSMDSSSALRIYLEVANHVPLTQNEGCSDPSLVLTEKKNSSKNGKGHVRSSSSIYKRVMKSSSFRRSSQRGAPSMKRSYSSNGKCSEASHSRSQDLILRL